MGNQPQITFIICTYNRWQYLQETLHSLWSATGTKYAYEILVIDNNSTEKTATVVQKYQNKAKKDGQILRYVKELNQGLSHARNRGIAEAEAPYIVFLDDDIRATPSLIPAWCSFFTDHPDAIAAGGKIHVQFDDPRPSWMSHFLLPLLGRHDLGNSPKKYPESKYPFGGNMGFRKSVFDEIGLFDTDLGRKGKSLNAGEEKELFRRIRSKSHQIYYLPDAFLHHRVNADRLTVGFIKKQALGLGLSMKLRLNGASIVKKTANVLSEIGKLLASVPLAIIYLMRLQPAKAKLLFKFRWWIWKGYIKQF